MTHLSEFSGSEAELLISLPYKVGLYISYADDEGGEGDDDKEIEALEESIKRIAMLYQDQPFIQEITKQTLSLKMEWGRWGQGVFQVPAEAQKAKTLLESKASEAEQKAYKTLLVEIATTVAQAHGEFNSFDEEEETGGIGAFIGKIVSGFSDLSKEDDNHPMNVSASEDSAIQALKEALSSA